MQKNSMNVTLKTLIGDMEEEDIFLEVTSKMEKKIETALGIGNTVSSSFSISKKQMILIINKKIEIIVNVTNICRAENKPLTNMENVMRKYDIDRDEINRVYKNDPALLAVPEPMMYIHKCNVNFEIGDCRNRKYTDVARSFINLMTRSDMIINNYN